MVLVIISQGKMELKEGSTVKIPYEDGFFDKACTVNCIYFWPDSVADLKDNLSDIQPKCYPLSSLTGENSCSGFVASLDGLEPTTAIYLCGSIITFRKLVDRSQETVISDQ